MKVLRWKLNLSEKQEQRIRSIVKRETREFDTIHTSVKPEISRILKETVSEINQELTSKQQKKFTKFYERVQS